jgi:hypothetical protein
MIEGKLDDYDMWQLASLTLVVEEDIETVLGLVGTKVIY